MAVKPPPGVEFSRPLALSRVSAKGSHERLSADADECRKLAARLDLPAIISLRAELLAKPWRGGGLQVSGEVFCTLEQVSVVSLESFTSDLKFPLKRYFMSGAGEGDDADIDLLEGDSVDLGEVVAETLALEIDPYPRKPGEMFDVPPEKE